VRRDAGDPHRGREVGAQLVDDRQRVAQRVGVLELEDGERGRRQHVGVAVAVAADPAAEAQRAGVDGEVDAEPRELVDQRLERVGHRVAVQLVEVVDGVARLVDHVGLGHAQLVALPQELDELLEAALDAALRGFADGPLALVEEGRDLAQLGQHRAPRGLGRVGREDRAHRQVGDVGAQLAGPDVRARDPLDGLRQPRPALHARGLQLAGAVDLLGHVGQVEVGREGAHEADRRERVDLREDGGGGVTVRAHELAHALDEVEHVAPLLAHDRAPQEHAELADVAAQRSLGSSRVAEGPSVSIAALHGDEVRSRTELTRRGLRPPPPGGSRARPSRRAWRRSSCRVRAGRRRRRAAPARSPCGRPARRGAAE
jgi:hypothetical protein